MGSFDLGPSIFVAAIIIVTVALVIAITVGHASPMALNACAQVSRPWPRGCYGASASEPTPTRKIHTPPNLPDCRRDKPLPGPT
jgi:hypothetical protein